ncbi:hypothetical protein GJ744_003520 [Endocarpon pusillum]|uniref:Uncharacterized protein n=1 Tax=Endocarpon pusillum TaxID=364733 RepID=A0A8H7AQP6_9EURO|nr:hypothetical protein GJ744_003520 [Endocarpon pusillum]
MPPSTDKQASGNGHGPLEILEIIKRLDQADIPSCIVGISALMYYGARRGRNGWDICVLTNQFDDTISLLKSNTSVCVEMPCPPVV